jgi:hypothetical protein
MLVCDITYVVRTPLVRASAVGTAQQKAMAASSSSSQKRKEKEANEVPVGESLVESCGFFTVLPSRGFSSFSVYSHFDNNKKELQYSTDPPFVFFSLFLFFLPLFLILLLVLVLFLILTLLLVVFMSPSQEGRRLVRRRREDAHGPGAERAGAEGLERGQGHSQCVRGGGQCRPDARAQPHDAYLKLLYS